MPLDKQSTNVGSTARCVSSFPCFYGYIVAGVGSMGMIATGPGQTPVIGTSITQVAEDLRLGRTTVSSAYLMATLGSACTLPFVGRLLDRLGPPPMFFAASLGLGLACFLYSYMASTFSTLTVCFYCLRLFGQGSLSLVSTNAINLWFVEKRSRVMGVVAFVNNVCLTGLFSALTKRFVAAHGWRQAYQNLGFLEVLIVLPLGLLFVRQRPETYSLLPDGKIAALEITVTELAPLKSNVESTASKGSNGHAVNDDEGSQMVSTESSDNIPSPSVLGHSGDAETANSEDAEESSHEVAKSVMADIAPEDFTLSEAVRTLSFWILSLGAFTMAALGTALFFHLDSIFPKEKGFELYLERVYLSSAVTAALMTIVTGFLADRITTQSLMAFALFCNFSMLVTCAAIVWADSKHYWPLFFVGILNGLGGGIFNLVCAVTFASWYGRTHNGSIQGLANSLIVFGSAVGPAVVSVGLDAFGSYANILVLCSSLPLVSALLSLCMSVPSKGERGVASTS